MNLVHATRAGDTVRLAQYAETPPYHVDHRGLRCRLAYARAEESRTAQQPGQDYVACKRMPGGMTFALCDGVGESFIGNVAAQLLGDDLVDWMAHRLPRNFDEAQTRVALTDHLVKLTGTATERILSECLPRDLPPMVQSVLREKQAFGSESTFVGGRIDMPGATFPRGRLAFAWLGDSRLRLWNAESERTEEFGNTFITTERWSSRRGPVRSQPHVFVAPLVTAEGHASASRVLAYSDGLVDLDALAVSPSDAELKAVMEASRSRPLNDDMSFIEIQIDVRQKQAVASRRRRFIHRLLFRAAADRRTC
jgi:hypothetical protein